MAFSIIISTLIVCLTVQTLKAEYSNAPPPPGANQFSYGSYGNNGAQDNNFRNDPVDDELAALAEAIPGGGIPGEDFPILASIPDTDFTCEGQLPGYYADTADEAGCQVFYICQEDGREDGFLCPNGTIFNQQFFVCDWWYNFDCASAEQFFGLNADIGKVDSESEGDGVEAPSETYGTPARNGNGNGNRNGNGNGKRKKNGSFGSKGNGAYGNNGNGFTNNGNGYSNNGNGYSNNGNGFTSNGNGLGNNGNGGTINAPSGLYQTPI